MSVSLCMIVKDEENVLARCLDSVKDLVNEIIVVDTGSTDRTKEIAAQYTSQIYDFKWINDFAAARNEGIRRATSRWVLVMDADEYFPPAESEKLKSFLEHEIPQDNLVYALSVMSYVGTSINQSSLSTGEIPRLFPNFKNIFYTRPIHEQLHATDGSKLHFHLAPGALFHTGYLKDTIAEKDKLNRNAQIFTEMKKKSGFSAYDYYTIGNEKGVKGDLSNAIYYYERSLKKAGHNTAVAWYPRCIISLLQAYMKLNRLHEAWTLIETKLIQWENYPEYHCMKALIYYHLGFFENAKNCCLRAFNAAEKLSETSQIFWLESADYGSATPLRMLADIADLEFDNEKSIYYLTKILMQNPYDFRALSQFIDYCSISHASNEIIQLLNSIYEADNLRHQISLLKVSLTIGSKELAIHFYEQLKEGSEDLDLQSRLGYALLTQDRELFESLLQETDQESIQSEESLIYVTIGALVWGKEFYDQLYIADDHTMHATYETYRKVVSGELPEETDSIYPLLTKCYLYQFYELYDILVNTYSNDKLINALANFFYSKKQYEIALNYYSILLRGGELNAMSCENMAVFHLQHRYTEDGLEFLEMTIAQKPVQMHLYSLYLQHCPEGESRQQFLKQFTFKFPFYRKIPVLAELVAQKSLI